jgi:ribosomal protein S18 acetylase RimI-like enzyme
LVTDPPLQDLSTPALIRAIEEHQRFNAELWSRLPGVVVEDRPDLFLFVTRLPVWWANGVTGARLRARDADARIDRVVETFRAEGIGCSWTVGPLSTPRDLGDRLLSHGFRLEERDLPWMAADLASMPRVRELEGLDVQRVRTPALHRAWVDAMTKGFESVPASRVTLDTLGRHDRSTNRGPWVRFVGFVDGKPAASSGLIVGGGGVAGIYNVTTLRRYRRRGFGTAMSAIAMRHARRIGHRVAVLATSPLGRGVYEGLGFRDVCTSRTYVWEPGAGILSPHDAKSPGDRDGR